jgi:membrane-associated phospholipid phosphatase
MQLATQARLPQLSLRTINDVCGLILKGMALLVMGYTIMVVKNEREMLITALLIGAFLLVALLFASNTFKLLALYVAGVVLFSHVRAFADSTGIPIHYDYAPAFDRIVGLGALPSTVLQDKLYDPAQLSLMDWVLYGVYTSYFSIIHILTPLVLLAKRDWFPRHVIMCVIVFWGGLLIYYLLPTAPPWLASSGEVSRVMDNVGRSINQASYEAGQEQFGTNPVAAMPSVHMAATVAVALTLWQLWRPLAALGVVYSVVMGFALIYFGEHYVIDVLAGVLLAVGAYVVVTKYWETLAAWAGGAKSGALSLVRGSQREAPADGNA